MSLKLINRSADLKRLRDEGYEIEVRSSYLLVHSVPYVTSDKAIKRGVLVSSLTLAGEQTAAPDTHVAFFIGDYPCHKDGRPIEPIRHNTGNQKLMEDLVVNHSFSNKPPKGYPDYFEKMATYIEIISAPARAIDDSMTAKTFKVIESKESDSVFAYLDTNSSRAGIDAISDKMKPYRVGIIGLGGTGAYALDLIAKTASEEIHLFDGDELLQHNAFRAPGAIPIEKLSEKPKKTDYWAAVYSKFRRGIHSHPFYITSENVAAMPQLNFFFLCLDNGDAKKLIIEDLERRGIPFIDVGMGVQIVDEKLIGIVRVTSSHPAKRDHVRKRVSFVDANDNDYVKNIQIPELNALNASMAVLKWKKFAGFYQDQEHEHNSTYSINVNMLQSEDHET